MNSFYCKIDGKHFYREDKKAENWFGPFTSRKDAVEERMNKRLSALKNTRLVKIVSGGVSE